MELKNLLKNNDLRLLAILLTVGIIFRFYKYYSLQYWSDDEQLLWYIIRHITVDKHPSLVVPNVALEIGLGPLYHYLLTPWFFLTNLNPQNILILGNLIGLINIILIYFVGKLISSGSTKVAFLAGLIYAASFMISLFDRRLWALTPDITLVLLSLIAFIKILNKKSGFIYLLIPAFVFQFNSDPSLATISLVLIVFLVMFRNLIKKSSLVVFMIISLILLSPIIIFEIRHQGVNLKSFANFLQESSVKQIRADVGQRNFILSEIENFSRFFYSKPTSSSEAYFCYCYLDDYPHSLLILSVFLSLVLFAYLTVKTKNRNYLILVIFVVSYLIGKYLFQIVAKGYPVFFYSIVISPILILIIAILIARFNKVFYFLFIVFFLTLNLQTLLTVDFKFPLKDKLKLAKIVQEELVGVGAEKYSLYYSGDILVNSGGFTALFNYFGQPPVKGNISSQWGHHYQTFELYPLKFEDQEPDYVVVISKNHHKENLKYIYANIKVGKLSATIYNNQMKWFYYPLHIENLYQPNYFKN